VAGIRSKTISSKLIPFLSSMALKKKGSAIKIPLKISKPVQNLHLKELSLHAADQFGPKAQSLKPNASFLLLFDELLDLLFSTLK
jgi:hypothetical protein